VKGFKMILAEGTLPEQVALALEASLTALRAAAEDGSEVARFGVMEVEAWLRRIGAVEKVEKVELGVAA